MCLGIINMPHQIVGQVGIKSITRSKESNLCLNQDRRASSVKLDETRKIFVSKFKAKHDIEEQSQCLEESQNCFESQVAEGFRFIVLNFLLSS